MYHWNIYCLVTWILVVFSPCMTQYPTDYDTLRARVTDCTYEFTSVQQKNGSFSSPYYPNPYPPNTACRYNFKGSDKERVHIIFMDLDLHYATGDPNDPYDCIEEDTVRVSTIFNGNRPELGVYCGSKRPPMFMSADNKLEVLFSASSHSSQAKGFKAMYKFVTDFGIKTGVQDAEKACEFTIHSDTVLNGTFTSPNFPGLYPRNTVCHYVFHGNADERVYITFPYFDVEGIPPRCDESTQSDYVAFSNFKTTLDDRKMNRYCGVNRNVHQSISVKSDGNFFRVTFQSNEIYDATVFKAFYQFRKDKED